MKKIGQGWQYIIYDLGNGRVRKIKPTWISQYRFIQSSTKKKGLAYSFPVVVSEMIQVNRRARKANDHIMRFVPTTRREMFGNPVFLNNFEYEQDKVTTLGEIFPQCSLAEGKGLVDEYVSLMQRMWSFGCSDMMFNFTDNNGVNQKGEVIESDFGELRFSKTDIVHDIKHKRWLQVSPYRRFPEGELKDYYRDSMNDRLTVKCLDATWCSRLPDTR